MRSAALAIVITIALFAPPAHAGLTWTVEQITTTGASLHKWAVKASDGCVAWAAAPFGQDDDVYYYDGTSVHQLTDNSAGEIPTDMDGGAVVWASAESGIAQTYVHRNGITTRLDTPGWEALVPRISGNNIAWQGRQVTPYQDDLFVYDGATIHHVTNDSSNADLECDISGNTVAWRRWDGSGYEVFTYQIGGTITNLSDSSRWASRPRIDGTTVAWVGEVRPNVRNDVFCYCGAIDQLTNLGYLDHYVQPVVSGSKIAWCAKAAGVPNVYLYDAATDTLTVLATNTNCHPSIDGDYVVWSESDGHDGEIFLYDGTTTYQITDDNISNGTPSVSGNLIAWNGVIDQFGNSHIYVARLASDTPGGLVPEPSAILLLGLAASAMRHRRRTA